MNFLIFLFLFLPLSDFSIERIGQDILVETEHDISRSHLILKSKSGQILHLRARIFDTYRGVTLFKVKKKDLIFFESPVVKIRIQKNDLILEKNYKELCL